MARTTRSDQDGLDMPDSEDPTRRGRPSEPPHVRKQPLSPEWMARAGFQLTSLTNHRGPLYRCPQPCHDCEIRGQQHECLVNAHVPAPAPGRFHSYACQLCNSLRRGPCNLQSRLTDWELKWDGPAGEFVRVPLPKRVVERRARVRQRTAIWKRQRLELEDDSSDSDEAYGDSDDDDHNNNDDHRPFVPSAVSKTRPSSAGPTTRLLTAASMGTEHTTDRPADPEPECKPRQFDVIELLDSSDDEDGEIVFSATSMTSVMAGKRPRNASAGPSNHKRSRQDVSSQSVSRATCGPSTAGTPPIVPAPVTHRHTSSSTRAAATASDIDLRGKVIRLEAALKSTTAELESTKAKLVDVTADRNNLAEMYWKAVCQGQGHRDQ